MKSIAIAGLAALSLAFAGVAAADDVAETTAAAEHAAKKDAGKLHEVSVKELSKLIENGKVAVFDANGAETRTKFGSIPQAALLTSAAEYDLSVLPADKSQMLVFYCANTRCTASDTAAKRAMEAGYTNVAVLRVGIKGWADAGQATSSSKS